MVAAHGILGQRCVLQTNPKHMVPSWKELGARIFVTRFLSCYVNTGCLTWVYFLQCEFSWKTKGKYVWW